MATDMRRAAAIGLLCALIACGGGGGSNKVTIKGTLVLPATSAEIVGHPEACNTSKGFEDISAGVDVRVTDEADTLVGTSRLSGPTRDSARCVYDFTVDVTPGKNFYQFEVSHRGKVSFSADDLSRQNNTVTLTLSP